MIAIFSGTRKGIEDTNIIREIMQHLPKWAIIMHGDARGIDTQVDEIASELGMDRIKVPANWEGRGKRGGPFRNGFMLEIAMALANKRGWEIQVYAFPAPDSVGTWHMVNLAKAHSIPVGVHRVGTE
jgi:hypothetical protein